MSENEEPGIRSRLLLKYGNRVGYHNSGKEGGKVWIKQGGIAGTGRIAGSSAVANSLGIVPRGNEVP